MIANHAWGDNSGEGICTWANPHAEIQNKLTTRGEVQLIPTSSTTFPVLFETHMPIFLPLLEGFCCKPWLDKHCWFPGVPCRICHVPELLSWPALWGGTRLHVPEAIIPYSFQVSLQVEKYRNFSCLHLGTALWDWHCREQLLCVWCREFFWDFLSFECFKSCLKDLKMIVQC